MCDVLLILVAVLYVLNLPSVDSTNLMVFLADSKPPFKNLNTTQHVSYAIPKPMYNVDDKSLSIKLTCEAEKPTRWIIWNLGYLFDNPVTVNKTRITEKNTTRFLSNLIIELSDIDKLDERNFSCLYESDWKSSRFNNNFKSMVGVAVELKVDVNVKTSLETVIINVLTNKSIHGYYLVSISAEDENVSPSCPNNIIIDLTNGTNHPFAVCNPKNSLVKQRKCNDLDTCESIPLFYSTLSRKNCIGSFATVNNITKRSNFPNHTLPFPFLTYCDLRDRDAVGPEFGKLEFSWSSFLLIYPSFGPTTWGRPLLSKEEAVEGNSITVQVINKTSGSLEDITESNNAFAENETVEFTCLAVQYLYMEAFEWQIGLADKNISFDLENQTYQIDASQNLLTVNGRITLHSIHVKWIGCRGPIWNSESWQTAKKDIRVFVSKPPNGVLRHRKTDSQDQFTCEYSGWPRPEITPSEPSIKIYGVAPNITWHETQTVPRRFLCYTVTCTLTNLKGSISLNTTTEGVSDSVGTINTLVIVCIGIICLLILALTILYYWGKRKNKAIKALQPTEQLTSEDIYGFYTGVISSPTTTNNEALLLPYNPDNEIDHDDITLDGSILGSGQFGIVSKGHIGPLCVAVKTVKPSTDIIYLKSLLSELKILQYVGTHRNIVNLIGANTTNIKKHEVLVVLDYCSNGNLASFLKQNRDCFINLFDGSNSTETKTLKSNEIATQITLTTRNLVLIAGEIACGMDHLSSKNVIHGDLAARNVLITEDFHAKICDFGLAKQLLNYSVYVQKIECPLPLRWMALESLQDMEFSLASDKWSYGICLWEIFSLAELPYPGVQWNFETYKMLQEGYRMEKPKFSNDSICRLMLQCWNSQPLERPSFKFLIDELKKEEDMLSES
ncbi:Vascular endothelial growth factor receptor 3 [Orchesella cincta]|uniref:Vascular endothelial growth factor receptor 3 n=1 Tax=Orchesella cincta TaxID=48709 RepID=A0A1D2MLG9_ORCCI|nr:Vascular endothelial growth factor receptor 3 [Orchesella cincta]